MESIVIKSFLSLAAVLGLMFLIVFILRKYMGIGRNEGASVVSIDVLGTRTFHPRRSIYVLRVLNKILVVGVTDGAMHTLSEIDDEKSLKELDEKVSSDDLIPGWFSRKRNEDKYPNQSFATFLSKYVNLNLSRKLKGAESDKISNYDPAQKTI